MYDIEGYELNVDDVEDEKIKNNIESLYQSIYEYTEQKNMVDVLNNITVKRSKQNVKTDMQGYSLLDILNFCNKHKIKCFGYDWKMQ